MSLAQLTDKIIKDAEVKKDSIMNGVKDLAVNKGKETEKISASLRNKFEKELEEKLSQNTEKVTNHAEQKVKHLVDETKREMLDSVFEESLSKLENASDDMYEKIISSLIKELPRSIDGTLFVKPGRLAITKKVLAKKNISCVIKEDVTLKDGFIIKSKTFEYDGTFEKLLQEKKKQLEVEIAHILFD
ncbi:MAG: V-type ATP synthase subunit E [Candidatus Pacebacteria bacterium]|nr:V-type ATP synthase subunit E [Candidatus Paceibacterota bacterium]